MKTWQLLLLFISFSSFSQPDYTRSWGTYFGGNTSELTSGKADNEGNVYMAGFIIANEVSAYYSNFTTAGCHQPEIHGGKEGVIAKFSPEGDLLWATYLGSEGDDMIYNLAFDSFNNLFVCGYTTGSTGLITAPADFVEQTFPNSPYKGFLAKFEPSGELAWAKYFPGVFGSIIFNDQDEMYGFGATNYQDLATPGAFDPNPRSNDVMSHSLDNTFLIKYNDTFNVAWCTYYPANFYLNQYFVDTIALDADQNLYVAGLADHFAPGYYSTPGCFQEHVDNLILSFISKFNDSGERIWSTYYGSLGEYHTGSSFADIAVSGDGVYLCGGTSTVSGIATPGAHQPVKSGEVYDPFSQESQDVNDGFLTKFDLDGNRIWGTYFGGELNDLCYGIDIKNNKIFVGGTTRSTTGIASDNSFQPQLTPPTTPENYFEHPYSRFDAFAAVFTTNGVLENSTYYGGGKSESIYKKTGIVANNNNGFYLFGNTSSDQNMASANGFQSALDFGTNANTGTASTPAAYNMYLARFDSGELGVNTNVISRFQLYPNPNNGSFTITGPFTGAQVEYQIIDLKGVAVSSGVSNTLNSQALIEVFMPGGLYVLKMYDEKSVSHFKLFIR